MPISSENLGKKFLADVERIAEHLIASFDLRWKKAEGKIHALERWLDFRYRYVEPRRREVAYSYKFPAAWVSLPHAAVEELKLFIAEVERGADLNRRQGSGLSNNNTGDKNFRRRTDRLWADWEIYHFHLNAKQALGKYYTERADFIAVCKVTDWELAVVDVIAHPRRSEPSAYSNPDFMTTVHRSWPDAMTPHRMPAGYQGEVLTEAQVHQLRDRHLSYALQVDDAAYLSPGRGLMANGISVHAYHAAVLVHEGASVLARCALAPDGLSSQRVSNIDLDAAQFTLEVHEQTLGVYEASSTTFFSLDRAIDHHTVASMYEILLPRWAMEQAYRQLNPAYPLSPESRSENV